MSKYTNTAAGPRGINLKDGGTAWIEPGATAEIDDATIADEKLFDGITKGEAAAKTAEKQAADKAAADAAAA